MFSKDLSHEGGNILERWNSKYKDWGSNMVNIFKGCPMGQHGWEKSEQGSKVRQWGQIVHNRRPDHVSLVDYDKDLGFCSGQFVSKVTWPYEIGETFWEAVDIILVWDDRDLGQSGVSRGVERWSDVGYILKVGTTDAADRLDIRRREWLFMISSLGSQKDGIAISWNGEDYERLRWAKGEIRYTVLDITEVGMPFTHRMAMPRRQ